MSDTEDGPTPPDGLPDHLAAELADSTPEELRNAIIYARELLQSRAESESPIDPEPGEDILRATERQGYTEVVKQFSCPEGCSDCPHGPYVYHVTEMTTPDGTERRRWTLVGKAVSDGGPTGGRSRSQ